MKRVLKVDAGYTGDYKVELDGVGYNLFDVPGKGDCLYHSLVYLLYAHGLDDTQFTVEKSHLDLRQELIKLAEQLHDKTRKKTVTWSDAEAKEDFLANYAGELKEMKTPRGYGSEIAMRAFVEALPPTVRLKVWYWNPDNRRWTLSKEFRPATNHWTILNDENEDEFDDWNAAGGAFHIAWVVAGYPDNRGLNLNHFCPLLPKDHPFDDAALDASVRGSEPFLESLDEEDLAANEEEVRRLRLCASRSHADASKVNTYDTLLRLPMIDIHCHVGGKSISGGMPWLIDQAANKFGKIGFYGLAAESRIIRKILNRMKKFCWEHKYHPYVAGNAVILDFAFTPLKVPTGAITFVKGVRTVWRAGCRAVTGVATVGVYPIYKAWQEHKDPHKGSLVGIGTGTEKEVIEANRKASNAQEHHYYSHPEDKSPPSYLWIQRERKFYERALDQISTAMLSYPGELWPFVGFDPRRADGGLDVVKKYTKEKGFVGVKLYSRTGWMPVNNEVIYGEATGRSLDARLTDLYKHSMAEDLPMLVHCSPTGFPPDGPLAMPWSFIQHQREHQYNGRPSINVRAPFKMAPWPPSSVSTLKDRLESPELMIRAHAAALALFGLYVQWTTSPYSWEPVLDQYKDLRLNLAHFGAEIGTYSTPRRKVPFDEDWNGRLKNYPYVTGVAQYDDPTGAPREGAAPLIARDFNRCFKHGVMARIKHEVEKHQKNASYREQFLKHVEGRLQLNQYHEGWLEKDKDWSDWLKKWEEAYPLSWHDKIRELLVSGKYKNLYTDIAYLTARDQPSFQKVFRGTVDEAMRQGSKEATQLAQRVMIGTDWFMTEMDGCTPDMFWNYAHSTFDLWKQEYLTQKTQQVLANAKPGDRVKYKLDAADHITEANLKILWRLWSSENSLRYLNLGARLKNLNKFYDTSSQKRPVWWKDLETFYAHDWKTASEMIPIDYGKSGGASAQQAEQAKEYSAKHSETAVDQDRPEKYQKAYTDKGDRQRQAATEKKAQKLAKDKQKTEKEKVKADRQAKDKARPDFKKDTKDLPAIPPAE